MHQPRPRFQRFLRTSIGLVALLMASACLQTVPEPAPTQHQETVSAPGFSEPQNATQAQRDAMPKVTRTVKVGMLLPLSGRHADLGNAMQNAATLALFDRYAAMSPKLASTKVELLPKDTGDTPEAARRAIKEALDEGAELLIGPIFSETVQAVAPIAKEAGVPIISFSNNTAVAGDGVYIFGFSPEAQTKRVIDFAIERGVMRIAALVPNSPYGQSVLKMAQAALVAQDQTLAGQGIYSAQGVGLDEAVDALIPPGTTPNFEALFLPEGSATLDTMLRTLDARGVRSTQRVQLLGTGLWDDYALVRRVNLEGAWLASTPPSMTLAFERRFRNTYSATPPRIASLGYDAVSLAVTLATTGRPLNATTLTNAAGFSGPANGLFRFLKNGTSERGLAVVQVSGGQFQVISPAPAAFRVRPVTAE